MYSGIDTLLSSVVDPDPGIGAFLTPGPGSGIRYRVITDPGSWIPDPKPIFEGLVTNFGVKSSINSLKHGPIFFSISKIK